MSHAPACIRPIKVKNKVEDKGFNIFVDYEMADHINRVEPYITDLEATSKCPGACKYCYASSTTAEQHTIPKEKIMEFLDDAYDVGIRVIQWAGGEVFSHADWRELVTYAADKGMTSNLLTSGLISKSLAKEIMGFGDAIGMVSINIASVVPKVYDILHTEPKTLEMKMKGYANLLEAGFPQDQVMGLITLSKPAIESIEETIDWFVDEMDCRSLCLPTFKACGFGKDSPQWEPSLSEVKRALEYRAKKLGKHWLSIGASDGSFFYCRVNVALLYDGSVVPCTMTRDVVAGNIYKERLRDFFDRSRDELLFNYPIEGHCGGDCEYSDVCFGCRATAQLYLGDIKASDPKCFMNPEAKELYNQSQ